MVFSKWTQSSEDLWGFEAEELLAEDVKLPKFISVQKETRPRGSSQRVPVLVPGPDTSFWPMGSLGWRTACRHAKLMCAPISCFSAHLGGKNVPAEG